MQRYQLALASIACGSTAIPGVRITTHFPPSSCELDFAHRQRHGNSFPIGASSSRTGRSAPGKHGKPATGANVHPSPASTCRGLFRTGGTPAYFRATHGPAREVAALGSGRRPTPIWARRHPKRERLSAKGTARSWANHRPVNRRRIGFPRPFAVIATSLDRGCVSPRLTSCHRRR
jgi:hypothetical protein